MCQLILKENMYLFEIMTVHLLTRAMVAQGPPDKRKCSGQNLCSVAQQRHLKSICVSSGNGHVMLETYLHFFLLQCLLWLLICSLAVYYPGKSILDDEDCHSFVPILHLAEDNL